MERPDDRGGLYCRRLDTAVSVHGDQLHPKRPARLDSRLPGGLLAFGYVKGRFTGTRPWRSAAQTMLIGGVAATAAFLIRGFSHQHAPRNPGKLCRRSVARLVPGPFNPPLLRSGWTGVPSTSRGGTCPGGWRRPSRRSGTTTRLRQEGPSLQALWKGGRLFDEHQPDRKGLVCRNQSNITSATKKVTYQPGRAEYDEIK